MVTISRPIWTVDDKMIAKMTVQKMSYKNIMISEQKLQFYLMLYIGRTCICLQDRLIQNFECLGFNFKYSMIS